MNKHTFKDGDRVRIVPMGGQGFSSRRDWQNIARDTGILFTPTAEQMKLFNLTPKDLDPKWVYVDYENGSFSRCQVHELDHACNGVEWMVKVLDDNQPVTYTPPVKHTRYVYDIQSGAYKVRVSEPTTIGRANLLPGDTLSVYPTAVKIT